MLKRESNFGQITSLLLRGRGGRAFGGLPRWGGGVPAFFWLFSSWFFRGLGPLEGWHPGELGDFSFRVGEPAVGGFGCVGVVGGFGGFLGVCAWVGGEFFVVSVFSVQLFVFLEYLFLFYTYPSPCERPFMVSRYSLPRGRKGTQGRCVCLFGSYERTFTSTCQAFFPCPSLRRPDGIVLAHQIPTIQLPNQPLTACSPPHVQKSSSQHFLAVKFKDLG